MDTHMGQLKSGTTYIYERVEGTTYARESGSSDRFIIGQDYPTRSKLDQIMEDKLWGEIRRKAKSHPGMQAELDRVIMFYNLLKDNDR